MNKTRRLLFRLGTLLILLAIAACMMVVGRGHTVYLDNKTLEYNGQSYPALYKIEIEKDGEKVYFKANKGVVLACGGFTNNISMLKAYCPRGFSGVMVRGSGAAWDLRKSQPSES